MNAIKSSPTLDTTRTFKQFLFSLAETSDYTFRDATREKIRKAAFLAATQDGKYLSSFFQHNTPEAENWRIPRHLLSDSHCGIPCARIFRKGEPIYRCLTCGLHEACALCAECFDESLHDNHKVNVTICQRDNGGVCDCGDPEAWVKEFTCARTQKRGEMAAPAEIGAEFAQALLQTFQTLLDFVIDVMAVADTQFDRAEEMTQTKVVISAVKSTLNASAYCMPPQTMDVTPPRYSLVLYNDSVRQYRDAVQRIRVASKKVKPFAEMVANRAHSHGLATVATSSNIAKLYDLQRELGKTGLTTCVRNNRALFREEMCDELLRWMDNLTGSALFKASVPMQNLLCLAFCGRWTVGLETWHLNEHPAEHDSMQELSLNNSSASAVPRESNYKTGKLDGLRIPKVPARVADTSGHWYFVPSPWPLPREMCEMCDYNLTGADYSLNTSHWGSRLQYICYFDVRFSTSLRVLLHDMYLNSLIINLKFKEVIGYQYTDIYPTLADMFLTIDREPECNVMSTLSTQLFTCPSNSASILAHGDVSRIFASIYGFLTVGKVVAPQDVRVTNEMSMASLKSRRWSQIFFDISYILCRNSNPNAILTTNVVPMACDILALFQGKPAMKREKTAHVEYESPDYTAFFQSISVIYQFAEAVAQALANVGSVYRRGLATNAISYVVRFLLRLEENDYPGLVDELIDINLSPTKKIAKELIGGNIVQHFRIDEEKASFLHPLHSFLASLIELGDFDSVDQIRDLLESATLSRKRPGIPNPLTSIFDYPLRTIVLMSQIKSGFWVRNGHSVRFQLQLYRSTYLRECGYMKDLFCSQLFIAMNNPNLSCFLIFSRWLFLDGWIVKSPEDSADMPYDPTTLPYMLEECINFFIYVLTETISLEGLDPDTAKETRIRNEIIHSLCFGPMNYTRLCSQIPEHVLQEKKFDLVLETVATRDGVTYTLKDEYTTNINPYYFSYSTNTRDDAIKFLKERDHKATGKPLAEIVIEPRLQDPAKLGIYRYIGNFSASFYFADFMIRTFRYIVSEGASKAESLLDTALHLVHLCSLEQNVDVDQYGSFYDRFVNIPGTFGTSMAHELYIILTLDDFKPFHCKIRAILKQFQDRYHTLGPILSDQIPNFNQAVVDSDSNNAVDESELKKQRALERKKKLMAKFKKQQSSFLKNNGGEDMDADADMDIDDDPGVKGWQFPEPHCILCQNAAVNAGPFGIITYLTRSSEFRTVPLNDKYWFVKAFSEGPNLAGDESDPLNEECAKARSPKWSAYMQRVKDKHVFGPGYTHQTTSRLISQSCAHGMHFQCYINFLSNNRSKSTQITRNYPENPDHKEFLCPLCKSINNVFIPVLWSTNARVLADFTRPRQQSIFWQLDIESLADPNWYNTFSKAVEFDLQKESILNMNAMEMLNEKSANYKPLKVVLNNMTQIASMTSFPQLFTLDSPSILTNTIKSTEIYLRSAPGTGLVVSQISDNALINLRILNEFRNFGLLVSVKNPASRDDALAKMAANILLLGPDSINSTIVDTDMFELLVKLVPIDSAGLSFNTVLRMCLVCQTIQKIAVFAKALKRNGFYNNEEFALADMPTIPAISDKTCNATTSIFERFLDCKQDLQFGKVMTSMLIKSTTVFLRRAAIYAFVSCASLKGVDVGSFTQDLEADRLCSFLNLPRMDELLEMLADSSTQEHKILSSFLQHVPAYDFEVSKFMEYPGPVRLIDIPDVLEDFFEGYYYMECHGNLHQKIEDPAICLFCASVVDAQKPSAGSTDGQCTTHYLKECPNDVGIFLLPKDRTFLLLNKNGGTFYNIPYQDVHGEQPTEAKKTKAMTLNKKKYDSFIRDVWLSHNVTNIIARNLDSSTDPGGWETM